MSSYFSNFKFFSHATDAALDGTNLTGAADAINAPADTIIEKLSDGLQFKKNAKGVWIKLVVANGAGGGVSASDVYTKSELDTTISTIATTVSTKVDATQIYTKTEVDTTISELATAVQTLNTNKVDPTSFYTKAEVDTKIIDTAALVDAKADKLTTYTKTEVDTIVSPISTAVTGKADAATTYTKDEVDAAFLNVVTDVNTLTGSKADKTTTYTKTDVDGALDLLSTAIDGKADQTTTYSKTDVDTALAAIQAAVSSKAGLVNGKIPNNLLPDSILGGLQWQGTIKPATQTLPTAATGNKGYFFILDSDGTLEGVALQKGDWAISNGTIWQFIDNSQSVTSVNGKSGAVVLGKADVGMANVDNTADAVKPVSGPQLTALNTKANLLSPNFVGVPTAPTAAPNTASTQLATTAFVLGQASVSMPAANGVAAIGTSTTFARADHVHASDVTKVTVNAPIAPGTAAKVTYDAKGLVTAGASLVASDIPNLSGIYQPRTPVSHSMAMLPGNAVGMVMLVNGTAQLTNGGVALLNSPTFVGIPAAPTAGVGTATSQLATTAFVMNHASNAAPSMDGVAAAGNSALYSRANHVHPSDTTKVTANAPITAKTGTKISYDAKGLVTGSTTLSQGDIPALDWSKITTSKPTTLAGYGITDALGKTQNAVSATKLQTARTIQLTGDVTGSVSFDGTGNASIATTVVNASGASSSATGYIGKEGKSIGALYNVFDRYNQYNAFSSSGQWTTMYAYQGSYGPSVHQTLNFLFGASVASSTSSQLGNASTTMAGPELLWGRTGSILGTDRTYKSPHQNSAQSYAPQSMMLIPLRNVTGSQITRTIWWNFASEWSSGYEGASATVISPNVNGSYSSVTNTSYSYVYSYTGRTAPTTTSFNVTIPANTTVLLLMTASMYYWTNNNGYEYVDCNKLYNILSTFDSSIVCDMRMLSTLYSSTFNTGWTDYNLYGVWTACGRDYGNR